VSVVDLGSTAPVAAPRIAVVIPAYRAAAHVAGVVSRIPRLVSAIYVVDDACPESSGAAVERVGDSRVRVLYHDRNEGVGAATLTGFRQALEDGTDVVVKLDADGQMDPEFIPALIRPLLAGEADYVKGNRFWDLDSLAQMPWLRLVGNAVLSFVTKFSTGYWNVFDPTNGYVAIHRAALRLLPLDKLSRRYFFESDLLFRLYTARAVVRDVPMPPRYGDETSGLRPAKVMPEFLFKHLRNLAKRLFYSYFLRDFNIASVELAVGAVLVALGTGFGGLAWVHGAHEGRPATAGKVMLAALPVIVGFQLLLAFLQFDYQNVPKVPLSGKERITQ
jgi:glycosyltransferase involved in cell wall biosynthesis